MENNAHQRFEDELAAYMLGSLELAEESAFELHLASCQRCQARERWLRASVEVLPSSVEQIEPPPALRERLMAIVREEAAESADAAPRLPSAGRTRRERRWRAPFRLRPAMTLASVLVLLAAGIIGFEIGNGRSHQTTKIAVSGTPVAPHTSGTLVRNGDVGVLRISNLPPRKGRVFEVWLVKRGKPAPAALFQVRADGTGSAGIPAGLDDSTQVLVTSEPPDGSTRPTTEPVASAHT